MTRTPPRGVRRLETVERGRLTEHDITLTDLAARVSALESINESRDSSKKELANWQRAMIASSISIAALILALINSKC
jgi:hypothetical protein